MPGTPRSQARKYLPMVCLIALVEWVPLWGVAAQKRYGLGRKLP